MGSAAPGAQNLGNAQGKITIDTRDLQRIQAQSQQVGQAVARNLGQIDIAAKRAQGSFAQLASSLSGVGAALGIASGAALGVQLGRFALQADAVATAYERQHVAALSLAGSQEKLNELLTTYDKVTGGAVDAATALADVTSLQALGFADSAKELAKFTTAARGISVVTGSQQDYIIGQLQLAIANQSTMRLDQLALGVIETKQRIDDLKAADKSLTGEMAYQNAILGLAVEKYGEIATSLEAQATGAESAAKAWKDLSLAIGDFTGTTVDNTMTTIANIVNEISIGIRGWGADLEKLGDIIQKIGQLTLSDSFRQSGRDFLNSMGYSLAPSAAPSGPERPTFAGRQRSAGRSAEQTDAIARWSQDVQEIEREAGVARVDATRQYEQQRAEIIGDYGQSIVREEADFGRNRARAVRDYNDQIADIQEDAAKREADATRDYAKTVARLQEDAAKREAEWLTDANARVAELRQAGNARLQALEDDYNKSRERAAEDHRDRLLDAAARLDAVGVRAEQRNYARQQQDAQDNFDEQTAKINAAIAEQTADAQDAHAERLQDARDADAERLADMQAAFDEQRAEARANDAERLAEMQADFAQRLADEDEDRAIQNQRRAEDHANQLLQLEQAQADRMAKINEQEAREKSSLEDAFLAQLNDLGLHNARWLEIQARHQQESLRLFERFWGDFTKALVTQGPSLPSLASLTGGGIDFAGGSSVPPARTSFPTSFADASRQAGGNVTFAPGSIAVYGTSTMDEAMLARMVRDEMIAALEEVR